MIIAQPQRRKKSQSGKIQAARRFYHKLGKKSSLFCEFAQIMPNLWYFERFELIFTKSDEIP
jgi:hypothetical protein